MYCIRLITHGRERQQQSTLRQCKSSTILSAALLLLADHALAFRMVRSADPPALLPVLLRRPGHQPLWLQRSGSWQVRVRKSTQRLYDGIRVSTPQASTEHLTSPVRRK